MVQESESSSAVEPGYREGKIKAWWTVSFKRVYYVAHYYIFVIWIVLLSIIFTKYSNCSQDKGYGFIECKQVHKLSGADIFVPEQKNSETRF